MPRYDYRCRTCKHLFEVTQSFDSKPGATCPECRSPADRQFSVPMVQYKGSGFYSTDYGRSSNGSASRPSDKSESSESTSSSSEKKKTEAKSGTKSGSSSSD